eukprot:338390-Alexandrium_andersonii.AAC.1
MHHISSSRHDVACKCWPPPAVILSMMSVDHSAIHRPLKAVQGGCEHLATREPAHPRRQSAHS